MVRLSDLTSITRSHTLPVVVDTAPALAAVATALLEGVEREDGVRLLGLSVSGFEDRPAGTQLTFALDGPGPDGASGADRAAELQAGWREVTAAVDAIRSRYGRRAVGPASLVGNDGVDVPGRRDAPWGPADRPVDEPA
jgi:DNA polymerase-4